MNNRAIPLLSFLCLLSHCSSTPSDSSLGHSTLPILSSPARADDWGTPEKTQTKNGYKLSYANPANSKEKLTITGSDELMFFLLYPPHLRGTRIINGSAIEVDEAQLWKKSLVAEQTVKWYHAQLPSIHYGSIFRTLGTELKDGSGKVGQYRIEVEGTKNQMRNWLSELRFH
jgi:hypothetical protein